jgi:hypothetical protein
VYIFIIKLIIGDFVKTVCLDFDGVLNNYTGWKGKDHLGEPKEGIKEFLEILSKKYDKIIIETTRDRLAVAVWLKKHGLWKYVINIYDKKPIATVYIDDRAIKFNGDFKDTLKELEYFNTYWEE